jgi:hypothetical protein
MEDALHQCQHLFQNIRDYGAMGSPSDYVKVQAVWAVVNAALDERTSTSLNGKTSDQLILEAFTEGFVAGEDWVGHDSYDNGSIEDAVAGAWEKSQARAALADTTNTGG